MSKYHTDVWEISAVTNQVEQYGHPAVCPVEIPFRSIQAYTGSQESLFEPFGGSGTTLIAAEKASKKAYLMELNPEYCDVIIKRWEELTGEKAVQITGYMTNEADKKILRKKIPSTPPQARPYLKISSTLFRTTAGLSNSLKVSKIYLAKGSISTPERKRYVERIIKPGIS